MAQSWERGYENGKSTEMVLEKDLLADILEKDFKTTVLKMLKELKEDMEKVCVNKREIRDRKPNTHTHIYIHKIYSSNGNKKTH